MTVMRFGPLQLESNLFLSPLAGYTNLPFRLVVREIGGTGLCTTDPRQTPARSLKKNPKALKLIGNAPRRFAACRPTSRQCPRRNA